MKLAAVRAFGSSALPAEAERRGALPKDVPKHVLDRLRKALDDDRQRLMINDSLVRVWYGWPCVCSTTELNCRRWTWLTGGS